MSFVPPIISLFVSLIVKLKDFLGQQKELLSGFNQKVLLFNYNLLSSIETLAFFRLCVCISCHYFTVVVRVCYCRYSGVFPSLNMAVKRREQTLQDYKRLQSKVEKYEEKEKTGPVMVKLHQVNRRLPGWRRPQCRTCTCRFHSTCAREKGSGVTCSYMLHVL